MPDDTDTLAAALYASVGLLARRLRAAPAPGELSMPERSVLARLRDAGPATGAELARAEQITPQALGSTATSLARRGLVERAPDPADGRRVLLSVTEAGRSVLARKQEARAEQLGAALRVFTPAERATLTAAAPLITRLGDAL